MSFYQRILELYDNLRPVLDVAIIAFLLYKAYELMQKTQAMPLLRGAGFLVLVFGIAQVFRLSTLQWILNIIAPGLFVAVAIVFQPELRQIIMRLGQRELFKIDAKPQLGKFDFVVSAAETLSALGRGALIVFPRKMNIRNLKDFKQGKAVLNADISQSLIVAIFQFDGPLHDGAMIIQNNRIVEAGCVLPLSLQQDITKSFGTRHRAALGLCEQSDAVVLVVSEESSAISLAYDSKLYYDLSTIEITRRLKELFAPHPEADKEKSAEEAPLPSEAP
jgi:diadenylate cyclase